MASGFYHVPRIPLSTSDEESGDDRNSDTTMTASDPEDDRRRAERRREAKRRRRRMSAQSGLRSSMTLPIIHEAVDGQKSNQDADRRYNIVFRDGRIHLVEETEPAWYARHRALPAPVIKLSVLVSAVLFLTAALVCLCLYTKSHTVAGSDAYVGMMGALFWVSCMLLALMLLLRFTLGAETVPLGLPLPVRQLVLSSALLAAFLLLLFQTSLPWRVSPRLQMVLLTLHIPFCSLANYVFFQKGINCKQVCCLLVLLAGIFVTVEPTLLNDTPEALIDGTTLEQDQIESLWYMVLLNAICWFPFSFWIVHSKKALSKHEGNFVSFLAWTMGGAFLILFFLFWVNFIPNFGQVTGGLSEYWTHVRVGVIALYGGSADVQVSAALTIIFLTTALLLYHILCTCEEPHMVCYSVALAAGVSGVGTIFWTLFSPLPNMTILLGLTNTGVFTLVGVVVTVLSAVGYAHFEPTTLSGEDDDDEETETVTIMRPPRGGGGTITRYDTFTPRPSPLVSKPPLRPKPQPRSPAVPIQRTRVSSDPSRSSPLPRVKSAPVLVSM